MKRTESVLILQLPLFVVTATEFIGGLGHFET